MIPSDAFDSLMADAVEVGKIIGGLRVAVQRRRALLEPTN